MQEILKTRDVYDHNRFSQPRNFPLENPVIYYRDMQQTTTLESNTKIQEVQKQEFARRKVWPIFPLPLFPER